MLVSNTAFVVLYAVGAAALVASAWTINRRWQARTSIRAAALLMVAASLWLTFQLLEIVCTGPGAKLFAVQAQYGSMLVVTTAWFVWVLLYTRNRRWAAPRYIFGLLGVDAAIAAMALTNERHHLIWSDLQYSLAGGGMLERSYGPGYWVVWVYLYLMFAAGMCMLGKAYLRAGRIYRWEVSSLVLASVIPWLFGLVDSLELSSYVHSRVDVTAAAVSSTIVAWLLFRLRSRHVIPVARQAILDGLSDSVVVIDRSGKIIDANPAARRMFTIDSAKAINVALREYWPEMPSLEVLKEMTGTESQEVTLVRGTSEHVYDLRSSCLRDGTDRTVCHVFVFRDITDRRRVEQESERLREELQYSRRLESLALFAGGMAHEFNNALTRMLGYTGLAQECVLPDAPVVEHLRSVERQIQRATELANQILAYSGRGRFMIEQVSLAQLVRENERVIQGMVGDGAVLRCCAPEVMATIEADPMQLRLMLSHLLSNAMESLQGYGNYITIMAGLHESAQDDLRMADYCHADATPGAYAILDVTDTGCGMDETTRARMFDPFFSTKFTGRGLGLAAVLGIVRGHKGWIRISSNVGQGTTVRVAFPLAREAAPTLTIQSAFTPARAAM